MTRSDGPGRPFGLDLDAPPERQSWVLKLDFVDANPGVRPKGLDRTEAVISRFKGPRSEWKTGIATWSRVVYEELWPSIDLELLAGHDWLKYHFVVHPGGDPGDIQLVYRGASSLELADDGRLLVETPVKTLADEPVFAYQEYETERREVAASYAVDSGPDVGGYGFSVAAFDQSKTLIIDPAVIIYAGYVGGIGGIVCCGVGVAGEFGNAIAVDGEGSVYTAGHTTAEIGTPSSPRSTRMVLGSSTPATSAGTIGTMPAGSRWTATGMPTLPGRRSHRRRPSRLQWARI